MAAALFIPLVADWVAPGTGTRCAVEALKGESFGIWGRLVVSAGRDVVGLGAISMLGVVACAGLVAMMAGEMLRWSVSKARELGTAGDFAYAEPIGTVLAGLAFMLTPGVLRAATRVGPLMDWMVAPLAGLALIMRFRKHGWAIFSAIVLLGYGVLEGVLLVSNAAPITREAFWMFAEFALVGILPALVFASLIRWRRIVRWRYQSYCLAVWAAVIAATGVMAFGSLDRGRVAERVAAAIVANAVEAGRIAIVSDGAMDDLFAFTAPDGMRVVTMAREREPEYGRELAAWVEEEFRRLDGDRHKTQMAEELAFAAGLGAGALIDEWKRCDVAGFDHAVATYGTYFPTVEKWREAYEIAKGVGNDGILDDYLLRLMGVCGNEIGCRFLEAGKNDEAWSVFWEIAEKVDRGNYAALVNLSGMLERGYGTSKRAAEVVARWREDVENRLKDPEKVARVARAGGRLYVDPKVRERHDAARRSAIEHGELPPRARRFVERVRAMVSAENADFASAREEIRKAIGERMVRADLVGEQLLMLDRALGNWNFAERDAIEILRINRHHAAANAVMGTMNARRGDWTAAERYLRRAGDDANAQNDLAYVLARTGRAVEAVTFARRAVEAQPENWNFHETLGDALVRTGDNEKGGAELAVAKELKASVKERGK